MKKALTASILLNLILLICLLTSVGERKRAATGDLPETNSTGPQPEIKASATPPLATFDAPAQSSESTSAVTPIPANIRRDRSQTQPILMPLVFQEVDFSKLGLGDEQIAAIADLREKFLDDVGGIGQNPNDPAYLQKWLKSQPEIDSDLRAMIGVTAFQNYQIEAVDQSTTKSPSLSEH